MKKILFSLVASILLLSGLNSYAAVDCVVTVDSGSGVGSLDKIVVSDLNFGNCNNDTVTFADGITTVTVDGFILVDRANGVIDGGGTVTVTGSVGGNSAIFLINKSSVTLRDLVISNTDATGFAVYSLQNGTNVQNSTLITPAKITFLSDGRSLLAGNNYEFSNTPIDDSNLALVLDINAFNLGQPLVANLSSALSADGNTWVISGTVDTGANRVEAYVIDSTAGTIDYVGSGTASGGSFSISLDVETYSPLDSYALLAMNDTDGSTKMSVFSDATFVPEDDPDFYADLPACETVDWLFGAKAWTTDYDDDGLTNAEEDANKNCTVDTGESDPGAEDSDSDGLLDGADNCPAAVNENQEDMDSDGLGDVCDSDKDGDTIPNESDNCPAVANADQADSDSDGVGDACTSLNKTSGSSSSGCSLVATGGQSSSFVIALGLVLLTILGTRNWPRIF